ncbi:hypothetical protein, partial [Rhizobium sp.]|uniref:hypothetical protein n=1 Tax=Rhizobium sp. TaxID=391 RepID=UPI003899F9FB
SFRKWPQALVAASRSICCRGNVLLFHRTSVAMFVAQATDPLQLLRDVGSGPLRRRRMTHERAICINFPSRLI